MYFLHTRKNLQRFSYLRTYVRTYVCMYVHMYVRIYTHTYANTSSARVVSCHVFFLRVYKNHLKMVQGCRIDTGSCKKPLSKKDSPKTLGTRLSCKTGTGLGGQRARQA